MALSKRQLAAIWMKKRGMYSYAVITPDTGIKPYSQDVDSLKYHWSSFLSPRSEPSLGTFKDVEGRPIAWKEPPEPISQKAEDSA